MAGMRYPIQPDLPPDLVLLRSPHGDWWVETYDGDRFVQALRFPTRQAALDWALLQAPPGAGFRPARPGRREHCGA